MLYFNYVSLKIQLAVYNPPNNTYMYFIFRHENNDISMDWEINMFVTFELDLSR